MNERIQSLADEAEDYADSIVDQGGEFHPAYTKKFAELIVRECLSYAKDGDLDFMKFMIREHFGVEE